MSHPHATRRDFLLLSATAPFARAAANPIDRRTLVRRHNPTAHTLDPRSPFSVGNGEFAFTADITGLQSLAPLYEAGIPLCTQSQWGWHSTPRPPGTLRLETFDTYGRPVGYATSSQGQEPLFNWLRENPHRLHLGRLSLLLDGQPLRRDQITEIRQTLHLWTGLLDSRFQLRGQPVHVRTCCHPTRDCLAIAIDSPLALAVALDFPYASSAISASDWSSPARHQTTLLTQTADTVTIARHLDDDRYQVRVHGTSAARAELQSHRLLLPAGAVDFTCEFAPRDFDAPPPLPEEVRTASAAHGEAYWNSGAALDLSASTDPRTPELERRVVLSQYLTAIQCAGSAPPQETGLTCNSWYGKFHLEMHWWHAAHFPLWGRAPLLERSMAWYSAILPRALEKARQQGYAGARWPKMTALDGRDSPSNIGELLIWQQPHPIALAELCYRAHPARETLDRYRDIVMATAEFMASFALLQGGRYVLGPPVIPAQENHDPRTTWNPTFELQYWREALTVAQQWRARLRLRPVPLWQDILHRLSRLPVKDGVYLAHENCPRTFTEKNRDHPSMLAALGMLSGQTVDRETMRRTLHRVLKEWHWPDTWGWDYPMAAMTAARLGEPETAIDALFLESPKNVWLPNGHTPQRADLPLYLPSNGGLLTAVALMAHTFPPTGWKAHWEGLPPSHPA